VGVKIFELVEKNPIDFSELKDKKIAIDTNIFLYQFLATIRQPDGSPLTDSKGQITSHLIGLFNRTTKLLQAGIKPCFVFEGKSPLLKLEEQRRRSELKKEAEAKYKVAVQEEDTEAMKKYAARFVRLTPEMTEEARKLVDAFGLPIIQAPSEGEAQSAYMANKGDVWASASQDADSLLFGAPKLIRNLAITGRRKKPGQFAYTTIKPELIKLDDLLKGLELTQDQLIAMSMLIGTDYNVGGIKGLGPKKSLSLVKEFGEDFEGLFEKTKWNEHFDIEWNTVFDLFKNPEVTDDYVLEWKFPDAEKIKNLLVEDHDFNEERVDKTLSTLFKTKESQQQKGLSNFF
jgi:flap endonuclease-1